MSDINYKDLSEPDFLKAVGQNGHRWADAFIQLWGGQKNEITHGLMFTWFSNALMASHDDMQALTRKLSIATKALERIRIEATNCMLAQDGKSIVAASDFQDIQYEAKEALTKLEALKQLNDTNGG